MDGTLLNKLKTYFALVTMTILITGSLIGTSRLDLELTKFQTYHIII